MSKPESEIQQEVQIDARYFNCTLLRNNSGALKDSEGRLVRYGLGNVSKQHNDNSKSSDLIGVTSLIVTQDMVGLRVGIFTAIEVKKEDWNPEKKFDKRETAQLNFINWIKSLGGFAGFCNDRTKLKDIFKFN